MKRIPEDVNRLLDDLGRGDLAGDLTEEFQRGRSTAWVSWQISVAVVSGVVHVVRHNPYLTFRALAVAWITIQVLNGQLPFSPHPEVRAWISQSPAWLFVIVAQYVVAGWIVSVLNVRYRAAMVIATTLFFMAMNMVQRVLLWYFMIRMHGRPSAADAVWPLLLWLVLPLAMIIGGMLPRPRWPGRWFTTIANKAGLLLLAVALTIGATSIHAQSPASQSFDVASIKPGAPPDPTNPASMFPAVLPQRDGGLRAANASLVHLIRFAYNIEDDQIIGGPAWKLSARFDITAKPQAGAETNPDAVRQRLRALLADRFKLQTHAETREMTVSALVIADKAGTLGRDLKPTAAVCGGAAAETCRTFMAGQRDANGRLQMVFRGVGQPISALANMVGQAIGRRVIDGTGLTGLYDFETDLPMDPQVFLQGMQKDGVAVPPDVAQKLSADDSPAMASVLQQRLGLRLETRRASIPVVVIDSAQMPTAD